MKSTIKSDEKPVTQLTFVDLVPRKIYNYFTSGSTDRAGIVLCMTEVYSDRENKRLVELVGPDAGEYWNTVMSEPQRGQHSGVTFTLFTGKIELSND